MENRVDPEFSRPVENDYSLGGGVSMFRNDIDHGFKNRGLHDEQIKKDAKEALYDCHEVDALKIEVLVNNACIYLKGTVDSLRVRQLAQQCVEKLPFVEMVENDLIVRD